jgi:ABC-type uncharacterized transport system substrate-binding protein
MICRKPAAAPSCHSIPASARSKNDFVIVRPSQENFDALSGLAMDLVRSGVDVIVTDSTSAAVAAFGATRAIPIVMTNNEWRGVQHPLPVRLG